MVLKGELVYNHLRGILTDSRLGRAIVETGGVGWELMVPLSTGRDLPAVGKEVRLLTHLVVREDALELCGFLTEEERTLFRTLIELSGIGPALALQILSSVTPGDFAAAVERQDVAFIRRIKGIGEKKAKRLILELKGAKTRLPDVAGGAAAAPGAAGEAMAALEALGLSRREAEERVGKVLEGAEDLTVEEIVKLALR